MILAITRVESGVSPGTYELQGVYPTVCGPKRAMNNHVVAYTSGGHLTAFFSQRHGTEEWFRPGVGLSHGLDQ